jgi:hypothetical protein
MIHHFGYAKLYEHVTEPGRLSIVYSTALVAHSHDEFYDNVQRLADECTFTFENFVESLVTPPVYTMRRHWSLGLDAWLISNPSLDPYHMPRSWREIGFCIPDCSALTGPALHTVVTGLTLSVEAHVFLRGEYDSLPRD